MAVDWANWDSIAGEGLKTADLLPGDPLANTINGIGTGAVNPLKAKQYDPNAASYQIANQYGGALGQALAGAQGRSTPQAGAASAGQVAVNTAPQGEFRGGQTALVTALQNRAAGNTPSAAEIQMRQGMGDIARQQRQQAAGARGMSPALAQRMAAQNIASAQQRTNTDAGALRAQEQAQAEQALGQHLAGARGQDIGLATNQAGLTQQTNITNAGFEQQTGLANQEAELQNRRDMDAATQKYIELGMSREEAQQKALADMELLKANQVISANQTDAIVAEGNAERLQKAQGGVLGAVSSGVGALLSDRSKKTAIKSGDKTSSAFLEGLNAHRFRYKGEDTEHLGVMAQDVERAPGGRGMVRETPHGKMIDVPQAVGRLLAASATLHQRIKKIEGANA